MKYLHLLLFSFLMFAVLPSCSDSKDEPINSVFAFSSSDKNISITNNGTNAVVNVTAADQEIKINLLGTFIHTDIESPSKWIKATVTDKVLTLKIEMNYTDNARSANIAIKANDQSEIVLANIAVNQAAPTVEDYDQWQKVDILMALDMGGGSYDIPTSGELEKYKWYTIIENTLYFRLVNREENTELIKVGDKVYPTFSINHIYDMYEPNDWWFYAFYNNNSNVVPYIVTANPPQSAINEYGSGLLEILNKAPIRYGDDIDVIQTSYTGLPKFADKHEAYVYVVQYRQSINNSTQNTPAKIAPRIR